MRILIPVRLYLYIETAPGLHFVTCPAAVTWENDDLIGSLIEIRGKGFSQNCNCDKSFAKWVRMKWLLSRNQYNKGIPRLNITKSFPHFHISKRHIPINHLSDHIYWSRNNHEDRGLVKDIVARCACLLRTRHWSYQTPVIWTINSG